MSGPWQMARVASRRPPRKPYKPVAPVGVSEGVLLTRLRDSGVDMNTLKFNSIEAAPAVCQACGYHVCSCERQAPSMADRIEAYAHYAKLAQATLMAPFAGGPNAVMRGEQPEPGTIEWVASLPPETLVRSTAWSTGDGRPAEWVAANRDNRGTACWELAQAPKPEPMPCAACLRVARTFGKPVATFACNEPGCMNELKPSAETLADFATFVPEAPFRLTCCGAPGKVHAGDCNYGHLKQEAMAAKWAELTPEKILAAANSPETKAFQAKVDTEIKRMMAERQRYMAEMWQREAP